MFVELHLLQNFAPSNLNRDDTNSPKDCEFGGYRRARISSQAIKRAMRASFADRELVPFEHRALRTKRLADELTRRFSAKGRDAVGAEAASNAAIQGLSLKFDKKDDDERKTEYLLFLGEQEIAGLASVCLDYWDELLATAPSEETGTGRRNKKAASAAVPKPVQEALKSVLDGGRAADLALFGRMLADLPERNIDAASQVAHAISTNRVSTEFDFYTAVDDLPSPNDEPGAGMMGTVEFNSACFYRYANLDMEQLRHNLGGDEELARQTLEAFLRAAVAAIPSGKQNSMAAQNPPSFVLAVVRRDGLWSLANAFLTPVTPRQDRDLVSASQARLADYWDRLSTMYGTEGIAGAWCISLDENGLEPLGEGARLGTLNELVARVLDAAGNDGWGVA